MLAVGFGSRCRGDYSITSDKDLLLLASDWEEIREEARKREGEGFSVSAFLFDKANYLVKSGCLFFKHIADEGTLVLGSQEEYNQLISQWQPARSYDHEVNENLDLLGILDFTPPTQAGQAAMVDILITSVRNVLIRRIAGNGIYVFSWNKIFREAQRHGMIRSEDIDVFLAARNMKNRYRQGELPYVTMSYLESLMDGAQRALGISRRFRFVGRAEMRSLPERFDDGTYKQLRAIELMCAEYNFDASLGAMLSWISQPSYFCANGSNKIIRQCQGPRQR